MLSLLLLFIWLLIEIFLEVAAVLRLRDSGECNFCNHQNPVIGILVNAIYVIATFLELVVVLSLRGFRLWDSGECSIVYLI